MPRASSPRHTVRRAVIACEVLRDMGGSGEAVGAGEAVQRNNRAKRNVWDRDHPCNDVAPTWRGPVPPLPVLFGE